jgi:tetratricopeptide (TPR) repeat protein
MIEARGTAGKTAAVSVANEEAERNTANCESLVGDTARPGREGRALIKIDKAKAVPICEAAVRTSPDSPRLRYNLGRAYEAQLDWAAARRSYEIAALSASDNRLPLRCRLRKLQSQTLLTGVARLSLGSAPPS